MKARNVFSSAFDLSIQAPLEYTSEEHLNYIMKWPFSSIMRMYYVRALNRGFHDCDPTDSLGPLMRAASKFQQCPVNSWVTSRISWSERKPKCPILLASLPGSLESWKYAWSDYGSDLILSVFCGRVRTIIIRHIITFSGTTKI